ncbi:hypothetical protein ACLMAB_19690 [Brevibacillus laterosporus]
MNPNKNVIRIAGKITQEYYLNSNEKFKFEEAIKKSRLFNREKVDRAISQ